MSDIEDTIWCKDALEFLKSLPDNIADLVFTSPPYEDCRAPEGPEPFTVLKGEDWVDWMTTIIMECVRVCRGLTAVVVGGRTRNYKWSATPALLMADLHRMGVCLRKPPLFHRWGVPGSGGPDWLRNNYEYIICATPSGKLPWSDNTAMGRPPKYPPGGAFSNRKQDGTRQDREYKPPRLCNPGNIITGKVGGGHMGHALSHENEAPFPEWLVEFFVRSFCPPRGLVIDPFGGSGTVASVAHHLDRHFVTNDIRESQGKITADRLGTRSTCTTVRPGVAIGDRF